MQVKSVFSTSESGDGANQIEKANWFTNMASMLRQLLPSGDKLFEKFENETEDEFTLRRAFKGLATTSIVTLS